MLATVAQWIVLATLTGLVVGSGTSLFLHGLFYLTQSTVSIPLWTQIVLLPTGGLINGLLMAWDTRLNQSGLRDSVIASVRKQACRLPYSSLLIKPAAVIVTLACGASAAKFLVIPREYLGLSLPLMDRAWGGEAMPTLGFLWKTLLVAITLGSGFFGGIVTPQFVIGAISGNVFAHMLGVNPALGALIGLVAVVAAASNTPIAAILMGVELFGGTAGTAYIAGAGIAAYLIIGHRSVYPDQVVAYPKTSWMSVRPDMPVGEEKFHLSYGLLKWLGKFRLGRRFRRFRRRL